MKNFNQLPSQEIKTENRTVSVFLKDSLNIDQKVVEAFGEEWSKFYEFSDEDIEAVGNEYFDIIPEGIINKDTYVLDVGCGTGRWTKYLQSKVNFVEAIDPSNAIFYADKLLNKISNVRLSKASADNIPFDDETFDLGMSIGVLHHIPDTQKAMSDCVKKVKIGGYFYTYLYYNFENRGVLFKSIFLVSSGIRKIVCLMPSAVKKIICDIIAVILYLPFVFLGKILHGIGFKKLAQKLPLSYYQDKSFFIIRNDALDRFGTSLEQRFSREEILKMMKVSGLDEIIIADTEPCWHAIGKRIK